MKSQLIGKYPDAGKDWRQEEKGMAENEMVGWHHWINGHEFEHTLGDCEGCKTQNSGLCSKEEKPRDPINQPSRCNAQEGLLSVAQTGDSDLLGGRAPRTANWASFLYAKSTYYQHIKYGLQSDWLHVCKAILLVQTSRATCLQSNPTGTNFAGFGSNLKQFYWYKRRGLLFKLRRPRAFQLSRGLFTGCILIGWLQVTRWGRGILPFHGKPKPKSRPPASPSPGNPT